MLLTAIVPIGNISNCSRNLVQRLQQAISLDIQVKLVFDRITVRDSEEFLRSLNSEKHLEVIQGVFSLKYLSIFTKCTNLSSSVEIYLKNAYPIILQYSIASMGTVRLCLAQKNED